MALRIPFSASRVISAHANRFFIISSIRDVHVEAWLLSSFFFFYFLFYLHIPFNKPSLLSPFWYIYIYILRCVLQISHVLLIPMSFSSTSFWSLFPKSCPLTLWYFFEATMFMSDTLLSGILHMSVRLTCLSLFFILYNFLSILWNLWTEWDTRHEITPVFIP